MRFQKSLATEVRVHMVRRGLNGRQLADRLGWNPMRVSSKLAGNSRLTVDELDQIAAVLNVPLATLIADACTARGTTQPAVYEYEMAAAS
jgi:transcriptional regulator with XRE-family HTH domain